MKKYVITYTEDDENNVSVETKTEAGDGVSLHDIAMPMSRLMGRMLKRSIDNSDIKRENLEEEMKAVLLMVIEQGIENGMENYDNEKQRS